jgi:hypothetical protein
MRNTKFGAALGASQPTLRLNFGRCPLGARCGCGAERFFVNGKSNREDRRARARRGGAFKERYVAGEDFGWAFRF